MRKSRRRGHASHVGKGKFDPEDAKNIKHTRIGVWDLYEEKHPTLARIPGSSRFETYLEMWNNVPFIWRMIRDLSSIRACWFPFGLYLVVELLSAFVPALSLWFSGQVINIVQTAVDERAVDKGLLFKLVAGRLGCSLANRFFQYAKNVLSMSLNSHIKQYYTVHMFRSTARLDVPTYDDPAVQRQLEQSVSPNASSTIAWDTISTALNLSNTWVRVITQLMVMLNVLRDQQDGTLLASLSFFKMFLQWSSISQQIRSSLEGVWAATTKNQDYVRMQGLKKLVSEPSHRQEIVAAGMWPYLVAVYQKAVDDVGGDAQDFHRTLRARLAKQKFNFFSFFQDPLAELPMLIFALRAVEYPASIPVSMASLNLITQTTNSFTSTLFTLFYRTTSISENFANVRKLYEVANISNKVIDGTIPFPENQQALGLGISVEFRNVSFRYPGSESYALRNTSFRIEKGQLCVIVGQNGSGKSTILKLIARIFDPVEGDILVDGQDIKTLKLDDLRRATCVLFQDYTHFPLSIKDNIGLGDPDNAKNDEKIEEAARLGGAEEFISRLPEGFDTYLERPVPDMYSDLPEGTTTLFGRPVDFTRVRGMGGMAGSNSSTLSGGQMQRIALSRTFMRSLVSEQSVGLLLFDEPSASLDPTAEHDLFERLRTLRGNKTMVFSSHRFGNLTRHADLILYMHDSVVVEEGTHLDLIKKGGEYARVWMLQAQQFLP